MIYLKYDEGVIINLSDRYFPEGKSLLNILRKKDELSHRTEENVVIKALNGVEQAIVKQKMMLVEYLKRTELIMSKIIDNEGTMKELLKKANDREDTITALFKKLEERDAIINDMKERSGNQDIMNKSIMKVDIKKATDYI
jgi:hypothetical protein